MKTKLTQYFRNIKRNAVKSFITIVGFSISIAVIFILSFFVISEKRCDRDYANIDNTYMVLTTENEFFVEEDAKEILLDEYPQIKSACRYYNKKTNFICNHNNFVGQLITTDEDFFNVFSTQFTYGTSQTVFSNIQGIVLTESFAKTVFQEKNPLGQIVRITGGQEYQVSGIIKDLPKNSSIKGDCFIYYKAKYNHNSINNVELSKLFLVLEPGTNFKNLEQNISKTLVSASKILGNKVFVYGYLEWKLFPFKDAYFNNTLKNDQLQHADVKLLKITSLVAFLILILAIINYVNLNIADIILRIKEIGIHKTNGATKFHIFNQFLFESIVTSILASLLAIVFAWLLIPVFTTILGKPVDFTEFSSLNGVIIFLVILIIGILSGVFPALSASKYSLIQILSKDTSLQGKAFLENVLTTFQFTISIAITVCIFVIFKQLSFIQNRNIGFNTSYLIKVDFPDKSNNTNALKECLKQNSNIINVSFTVGSPMEVGSYSGSGKPIKNYAILSADDEFIETFKVKLLLGRNINYPSAIKECLITENAFKEAGWKDLDNKMLDDKHVVGVINTFNSDDLRQMASNVAITNSKSNFSAVNIRINPIDASGSLKFIKQLWEKNFPEFGFRYTFYDLWEEAMFNKEKNHARVSIVFGILSVILSCMGLFGLTEHSLKNKTKEIGIRKVNGAKISEVMVLLNRDFVKWVAIAFVIAVPIAYYAMNLWLENFAYKTTLSWWIFALAGLLALGIALLTVSFQSWKAATRNPVEALRYE